MTNKFDLSQQINDAVIVINNKLESGYSMELVLNRDKLLTYLKEVRLDSVSEDGQKELDKILNEYK